jgi:iron complex outermembrane receptor protein
MFANFTDRGVNNPAIVPLGTLPALDLLNLNLDWSSIGGSPVDVGFFVTNVADKQYYTYVPGLYGITGFEAANLGLPRMFGGRIRYRF